MVCDVNSDKGVVNSYVAETRFIKQYFNIGFLITINEIFKTSFSSACLLFLFQALFVCLFVLPPQLLIT